MRTTIPLLLITVALTAAEPKPLTTDQQLKAARAQAALFRARDEAQQVFAAAKEAEANMRKAQDAYLAMQAEFRKESGAGPGCNLDDKQAWTCAPPASAKPDASKAPH